MAGHLAGDHDIIKGEVPAKRKHRPFRDPIAPFGDQFKRRIKVLLLDRRKIAEPAEIETDHRHTRMFMYTPQNSSVAAEGNNDARC